MMERSQRIQNYTCGYVFKSTQHLSTSAPIEVSGKTPVDFNGNRGSPLPSASENTTCSVQE